MSILILRVRNSIRVVIILNVTPYGYIIYTGEDLHLFSFTKACSSGTHEPCETPSLRVWAVSRREGEGKAKVSHIVNLRCEIV